MIKYLSLASLLLIGYITNAQVSFNLDEAIAFANKNNNVIKLKQLEISDASSQVNEFKSIGLPTLSAGIGYQYYFKTPSSPVEDFITPAVYGVLFNENVIAEKELGPLQTSTISFVPKNNLSANIEANWLIFDGSYLSGLKAAKLYKNLVGSGIEQTIQELKSEVTRAYLSILIAQKNLDIIDKNIENISRSYHDVQQLYKNGFVEQLDVDRLKLSKENLDIERDKLIQVIRLSKNILKFKMAYPIEKDIELSENLDQLLEEIILEDKDIYSTVDYNNRAEYKTLQLGIALNELNHQRISRTNLPSLKIFANYSESLQRNDLFDGNEADLIPTAVAGLNLNIPIFDGNLRKSQLQRSKIALEKSQIEKKEFERAIDMQSSNARLNLINAKKNLDNQKRVLALNQKIFDVSQIKYTEGVGSSLELTQSETSLYNAQGSYINALYNFILSKTELDIVLGQL